MSALPTLESLYEKKLDGGIVIQLPSELNAIYGHLRLVPHQNRPYVIGNFVTTLDGVASLNIPGYSGGAISGFNTLDRIVMGLLRSVADAVIVGAGTLRSVPDHLWTADYIYPDLSDSYKALRTKLNKSGPPLNVIVTASGEIDLRLRVFQSGEVPVLIVTTTKGADHIQQHPLPPSVQVKAINEMAKLSSRTILESVIHQRPSEIILVEGGPTLMGDFFAEQCLDELFLTFAPQIAGRDKSVERPGFVAERIFAPERPLWGTLIDVRRGDSHLFLRYAFE